LTLEIVIAILEQALEIASVINSSFEKLIKAIIVIKLLMNL
jgi:hypothetical protein